MFLQSQMYYIFLQLDSRSKLKNSRVAAIVKKYNLSYFHPAILCGPLDFYFLLKLFQLWEHHLKRPRMILKQIKTLRFLEFFCEMEFL